MYSVNSQNPFGGLPTNTANMMEFGQQRFNPLMGVMSPTYVPYATTGAETTRMLRAATNNPDIRASSGNRSALTLMPTYNPVSVPNENESRLQRAVRICEAVKTDDCTKFRDPDFMKNCVMAHEPGIDSMGNPHKGGFVLFDEDKQRVVERSNGRFPRFNATVGRLPTDTATYAQRVSYDEKSCLATQKRINCEVKKTYEDDCAICNNGSGNHYDLSNAAKQSPSLFIVGSGNFELKQANGAPVEGGKGTLQRDVATEILLPPDSEGKTYYLMVEGDKGFVAGYLQGQLLSGFNRTDLKFLTKVDSVSGSTPTAMGLVDVKQQGTISSSVERMSGMRVSFGKKMMNIDLYIPYTFAESSEPINYYCTNAPFSRTKDGAAFAGNDPCLVKGADGKFRTEISAKCLADRWTSVGCTTMGSLYPLNEAKGQENMAKFLEKGDLSAITDFMYDLSMQDKLGRNSDGTEYNGDITQRLKTWDAVSKQCSGASRTNPCDFDDKDNGPLSDACLTYLYNNEGGDTYKAKVPEYASLKNKTIMGQKYPGQYSDQQCTPFGSMNPNHDDPTIKAAAIAEARKRGGVVNVKNFYSDLHVMANADKDSATGKLITDKDRNNYMQKCYGINLSEDQRLLEAYNNYQRR